MSKRLEGEPTLAGILELYPNISFVRGRSGNVGVIQSRADGSLRYINAFSIAPGDRWDGPVTSIQVYNNWFHGKSAPADTEIYMREEQGQVVTYTDSSPESTQEIFDAITQGLKMHDALQFVPAGERHLQPNRYYDELAGETFADMQPLVLSLMPRRDAGLDYLRKLVTQEVTIRPLSTLDT